MAPKLQHFLVCEDVRVEHNGLLDLNGLVTAEIAVPGPGVLPKLSLVLILSGMQGIKRIGLACQVIVDGQSAPLFATPQQWNERQPDKEFHNMVTAVAPFPLPVAGKYKINAIVAFDDVVTGAYSYSFEVKFVGQLPLPTAG